VLEVIAVSPRLLVAGSQNERTKRIAKALGEASTATGASFQSQ
jgi:hypothetical protein